MRVKEHILPPAMLQIRDHAPSSMLPGGGLIAALPTLFGLHP
jgi:hypothetical protein